MSASSSGSDGRVLGTAAGSMPGGTVDAPGATLAGGRAYAEAVRTVLGVLAEEGAGGAGLPFVPEQPGRGVVAGMVGRALALAGVGVAADLQPAGWRLLASGAAGMDQRRAASLLAQDLDVVEELAGTGQGDGAWTGPFKTQVAGPWTLAATVEKPRGDKVVSDPGARRDLAQALAAGVAEHVADLRRRLPGVERWVVQVDEPALAAVAGAQVPTASGFGRHRAVDRPELSEALGWVLDAVRGAGAEPWVHSCAPGTPWDLVRTAGSGGPGAGPGLVVDHAVLSAADHDQLAEAYEAGQVVALGVVPGVDPAGEVRAATTVERWLDMLGLEPGPGLVVGTACGLAGASPAWARRALETTVGAATSLR